MVEADDVAIHGAQRLRSLRAHLRRDGLTRRQRFSLADALTSYGLHGEARSLIAALLDEIANASARRYLERLVRVNDYVAGLPDPITEQGDSRRHARPLSQRSSYWPSPTSPRRLVVVFATSYNNFQVSFPVLHAVLGVHDCSVLYVKNPGRGMFTGGSPGLGGSIDAIAEGLRRFCRRRAIDDVRICGFSSGGYASFYAAAALGASSYLGFGIRTDWSEGSPLKAVPGRAAPLPGDRLTNTLVNLRDFPATARIGKVALYHGALSASDAQHARNMRGLANVTVHPVAGAKHGVIQHLMADRRFDGIMARFLADGPD